MDIQTEFKNKNINSDEKYNEELDHLATSVKEIGVIHDEMNKLVSSQSEKIESIDKNIDKATDIVDSSNNTLFSISDYQKSIFWKKGGLLTIGTTVVAVPIGILAGPKIAIAAGAGALLVGGFSLFS
jgi:t-SNARE complex subunit (syntaxin)